MGPQGYAFRGSRNERGFALSHQVEMLAFTAKPAAAHLGIALYRLNRIEYFRYSHKMLAQYLEKSTAFSYKTASLEG